MLSNPNRNSRQNCQHNFFDGLETGPDEARLVQEFFDSNDFSENTREAVVADLRKFAKWFSESNREPFAFARVTMRDVIDFRTHLHRQCRQAVATCNRRLVMIRRIFNFLVDRGLVKSNPAKHVRNLKKVTLPPVGLERADVRKLLRQLELAQDVRANAIFHLMLFSGCRVSDVVNLELKDLVIGEKSGHAIFRHGKGNKERTVPLPNQCRKAISDYLGTRPPVESDKVFVGERGSLTVDGIQFLCRKYGAMIGVDLFPHKFRHTFAKKYLEENQNDLPALAMILGHSNLNTTSRYAQKDQTKLAEASEKLSY